MPVCVNFEVPHVVVIYFMVPKRQNDSVTTVLRFIVIHLFLRFSPPLPYSTLNTLFKSQFVSYLFSTFAPFPPQKHSL
jgi:hypothetical protein